MNKEIKEIYLSNLEWIKAHDDIGGVKGNLIFKDNMSCEEYKKLVKSVYFILCNKDYITNLQQENERLKDTLAKIKDLNTMQYLNEKNFKYSLNEILQNGSDDNG